MKGNGAGRRGRSKGKKERKRKGEKQTANDNPRTLGSGVMRTAACPTKGCYFLASETIVIIVIMLMGRQNLSNSLDSHSLQPQFGKSPCPSNIVQHNKF